MQLPVLNCTVAKCSKHYYFNNNGGDSFARIEVSTLSVDQFRSSFPNNFCRRILSYQFVVFLDSWTLAIISTTLDHWARSIALWFRCLRFNIFQRSRSVLFAPRSLIVLGLGDLSFDLWSIECFEINIYCELPKVIVRRLSHSVIIKEFIIIDLYQLRE